MMNKCAAFIVNSPFQALCALEAISHYNISEPHFILFDRPVVHDMTEPLLKRAGNLLFIRHDSNGTKQLLTTLNQVVKKRYHTVFIGDYFSYSNYAIAVSLAALGARLIYLDDGNSTLALLRPNSRHRYHNRNEYIGTLVFKLLSYFKLTKSSFFSIYDIEKKVSMHVEKNFFTSLLCSNVSQEKDIYVIGTNSSKLQFLGTIYLEYLTLLASYIQSKHLDCRVYYCAHRRDTNDYSQLIASFGWQYFNTEISVEIDFIRKGINPLGIYGFCSTALLTLKKIYPHSQVCSIYFTLQNPNENSIYRAIEEYYKENQIDIIKLV